MKLPLKKLNELAAQAQVSFCLGNHSSFEVAFARAIEAELAAPYDKVRAALLDANEVCRSAFVISHRIASALSTHELGTAFGPFSERALASLRVQHAAILETGGYPDGTSGHNALRVTTPGSN